MTAPTKHTLTAARDGYNLSVTVIPAAREDAPWIVFGNSLMTDQTIWNDQVDALAGDFGLLLYDQAGHGASGVPQAPFDFDDLGADVLAVMDAASVDKAIYVGLSMGVPSGLSAHKMASDHFTALVFSDGQAKTAPGGAAGWAERIENARLSGMKEFANATADRWLTSGATVEMRDRLVTMMAATPFDGFATCATALMDYDYAGELAAITCPTLLLVGAEDGAMPQGMATKLQPAISGSVLHEIKGAGHVPCLEQPAAFNAHLLHFIQTVSSEGAA